MIIFQNFFRLIHSNSIIFNNRKNDQYGQIQSYLYLFQFLLILNLRQGLSSKINFENQSKYHFRSISHIQNQFNSFFSISKMLF
jgi:hypothetical protein